MSNLSALCFKWYYWASCFEKNKIVKNTNLKSPLTWSRCTIIFIFFCHTLPLALIWIVTSFFLSSYFIFYTINAFFLWSLPLYLIIPIHTQNSSQPVPHLSAPRANITSTAVTIRLSTSNSMTRTFIHYPWIFVTLSKTNPSQRSKTVKQYAVRTIATKFVKLTSSI